jgi:prepilin-type processing-associated H-X9-DG protein
LDFRFRRFSYGYNIWGVEPKGSIETQLGLGFMIASREPGGDPRYLEQKYFDLHRELKATRVKVPSEMIAIADSTDNGDTDFAIIGYSNYHLQPGSITGLPVYPAPRHGGGTNVLFCDGHVQWHAHQELVFAYEGDIQTKFAQRSIRRMWNNDHQDHW